MFDGLALLPFRFLLLAALPLLFSMGGAVGEEKEAASPAKSHPVCDLAEELKDSRQIEIVLGGWSTAIYRNGQDEHSLAGPMLRLGPAGRVSGQMVCDGFDGAKRIHIGFRMLAAEELADLQSWLDAQRVGSSKEGRWRIDCVRVLAGPDSKAGPRVYYLDAPQAIPAVFERILEIFGGAEPSPSVPARFPPKRKSTRTSSP